MRQARLHHTHASSCLFFTVGAMVILFLLTFFPIVIGISALLILIPSFRL